MIPYVAMSIFKLGISHAILYCMPLNGLFMSGERAFGICVGCLYGDY